MPETPPPPQFDAAALASWMAETRAERSRATAAARARLLGELRALGVSQIISEYDAAGDSGNVESLVVFPQEAILREALETEVENFVWDFAYALHPGFENNDGGFGELSWNLGPDKIELTHNDRYTTYDTDFYDEGDEDDESGDAEGVAGAPAPDAEPGREAQ